jgi:alkylation response protein AidB-like acyl-CoA dehydrogenase
VKIPLTQEQEFLRETIRDFARNELAPHVLDWDEAQSFPREVFDQLGEMGMMGILVDPEYEGAGLSYLDYVLVLEELSRVDGAIGLSVAAHNSLCLNHIYLKGSDQQKEKYLSGLATGRMLGGWALTEPGSGSDAGSTQTRAVLEEDCWILNGTKSFVTHGTVADVYVILAVTDPEEKTRGISAFIVEKQSDGLIPGRKENKLGCRASDTASIVLENCRIGTEQMLGDEGQGFVDALTVLDGGRISIAAMALGIAQGAMDCSLEYSTQREQFNRPISDFQAIRFKLADMATRIEAARTLTYQAALMKEQAGTVAKWSSMAKLFSSEIAVWASEEAVQIHGGYGYTKDYPAEKFWRDSKVCTIGEGTSEIQRMVIARELLSARNKRQHD